MNAILFSILMYTGAITLICGTVVILYSINYILGEMAFHATWCWGNSRRIKRSVKLGWNTGEMPENKPVLVREYADSSTTFENDDWAVMIRKGDRIYTPNGSNMSIKNITGWLEIVE